MVTVACVLLSGGIYTPEWVAKLKRQVEKHLTIKHRFVCLSDVDVPCERISITGRWPRWWSKFEMFRPGLLDGPVVYFDLDTIVLDNIDGLVKSDGFWLTPGPNGRGRPRAGCLSWNCSTLPLWDDFSERSDVIMKIKFRPPNDEGYYPTIMPINVLSTDEVQYYDRRSKHQPDCRAVTFWGRYKPNNVGGWASRLWCES